MRVVERLLNMVLLVVSSFVLAIKVLVPTTIQVFIQGELITLKQVPNIYTLSDIIVVAIFSCVLGVSASYLLFSAKLTSEHELTVQTSKTVASVSSNVSSQNGVVQLLLRVLKENERRIVKILLENGEMNQSELASRTNIPKSTLSRVLADLEKKELIIRYEKGMSKMVKFANNFQKEENKD